jgi:hypothetical protein
VCLVACVLYLPLLEIVLSLISWLSLTSLLVIHITSKDTNCLTSLLIPLLFLVMLFFMRLFFPIILILFLFIHIFITLFSWLLFFMMILHFLLILLFLHLLISPLSFLFLFLLSENLHGLNINLVIFKISIVNWLHLLYHLHVILQVLQVILILLLLFFLIKNCHLLTNTMFFQFLLQLSPNFITKQSNILAAVMPCKLKSRLLRIIILGPLYLYLLTKLP